MLLLESRLISWTPQIRLFSLKIPAAAVAASTAAHCSDSQSFNGAAATIGPERKSDRSQAYRHLARARCYHLRCGFLQVASFPFPQTKTSVELITSPWEGLRVIVELASGLDAPKGGQRSVWGSAVVRSNGRCVPGAPRVPQGLAPSGVNGHRLFTSAAPHSRLVVSVFQAPREGVLRIALKMGHHSRVSCGWYNDVPDS